MIDKQIHNIVLGMQKLIDIIADYCTGYRIML